jgi:hypothetical protein
MKSFDIYKLNKGGEPTLSIQANQIPLNSEALIRALRCLKNDQVNCMPAFRRFRDKKAGK